MNINKKSFLILVAMSLAITLLCSCFSTVNTGPIEQATLTFYLPGQAKPDAGKVLGEIEKKTENSLNIKLNFKWFNGDYQTEIYRLLASDEPIDAYCSFVRMDYQFALFENSKLKDIREPMRKYAPKLYAQYGAEDMKAVTFKGKMVFVPELYPLTNATYAVVREDLRKKYNIPEISTFEAYEEYLKNIKMNERTIVPGALSSGAGCGNKMGLFLPATDYCCVDAESELVCRKDGTALKVMAWEQTAEFGKMIELFTGWQSKQYLLQNDIPSDWWNAVHNWFSKGRISSLVISERDVMSPIEPLVEASNKLLKASSHKSWELKAYRLYPEKKAQRVRAIERSGFTHLAFPSKSKNTERVLAFLNWIMSEKKNYDLFMYGIEGEHYVAEGDHAYSLPDGVKFETDRYAGWSGSEVFKNSKFERYPTTAEAYDRTGFLRENAEYSPCTGFYADLRQFTDILNKRINFIYRIESELSAGKFNPSGMPALVSEMKNAGAGQVVNEVQKQLDEWLKLNKGRWRAANKK